MDNIKVELIKMLNQALELEHAARIQYLSHAELVKGLNAEKIIERLKEIAGDEAKHEDMFRNLIGNYLGGEPSMAIGRTRPAKEITQILNANVDSEKEGIDLYKKVYEKVIQNKAALSYEFETLEHDIRHIIVDEQEHLAELKVLLGQ